MRVNLDFLSLKIFLRNASHIKPLKTKYDLEYMKSYVYTCYGGVLIPSPSWNGRSRRSTTTVTAASATYHYYYLLPLTYYYLLLHPTT